MSLICKHFERSRSWYYDTRARSGRVREYERMIVSAVEEIRRESPFYGTRKLWHALGRQGIGIGRDKLHKILNKYGLTLPRHYKKVRTSFPGIYDAGFPGFSTNVPCQGGLDFKCVVVVLAGFYQLARLCIKRGTLCH